MGLSLVPPRLPPGLLVRAAEIAPLAAWAGDKPRFAEMADAVRAAPLHEIAPREAGDAGAALGFALGLSRLWADAPLVVFVSTQNAVREDGALYGEGYAQLGLELDELLVVRTRNTTDALWATEQALTLPGAVVICALGQDSKALDLTASRRLLLTAETYRSRGVVLRMDKATASAAWTRWAISSAPSDGVAGELGQPAVHAHLVRQRAGRGDLSWILNWNAHEHSFSEREAAVAGDLAAAPQHGSALSQRRSA